MFSVTYELGMHAHDVHLFQSPIVAVDHIGDPGVGGRIILRWIFRKWDVGTRTGSSWVWIGAGGGLL